MKCLPWTAGRGPHDRALLGSALPRALHARPGRLRRRRRRHESRSLWLLRSSYGTVRIFIVMTKPRTCLKEPCMMWAHAACKIDPTKSVCVKADELAHLHCP